MPERLRAEARRLVQAAKIEPNPTHAKALARHAAQLAQRAEILALGGMPASDEEIEAARRTAREVN
jgi:hypothetical protein